MLKIIMLCLLETKCILDKSHKDKLEMEEWNQGDNKAMVSQEKTFLGTSKNKGIWGSLRRKQKTILPSPLSDITDIDSKSIFSYVTLKRPAKNKKNSHNKPVDPNLGKFKEGSQMLDVRKKRSSFYKLFYIGKKDKLGHKNYTESSASENLYNCDYSFSRNETFSPNENSKRFKNKCLEYFYQDKSIIKDDKYEIEKYCTLPRNIHKKISSESSNAVNPKPLDIIHESDYSTNKLADTKWKFTQKDDKILEELIYDIPKHVFFRSKDTKGKDFQKCSCGFNQKFESNCEVKDFDKVECSKDTLEMTSNPIKSVCDEPIYDVPKHVFFRLRNNLELCSCIYNHTHRADFTLNNFNKIALTGVTNKPTKNINHKNDQEPIYGNLKHLNHFSILPTEKKYNPLHFYQLSIPIQEINNKYKPFNPLTRAEKDDKNFEPLSPLKEEPIYEELDFSKVKLSED